MIETTRLRVRHFVDDDASFILRLLNEPSFLRYIGDRGVRNIDDARAYIANGPLASYTKRGYGLNVVTTKDSDDAIGMCGVVHKPWLDDPDIAYAFLPESGGRGYASEAAYAVLQVVRSEFGVGRVVAVVTPDNAASIRVLDKLDFSFERMIEDPAGIELKLFGSQ